MKTRWSLMAAVLILIALSTGLFAPFLTGTRYFIGNTDRFNVYLTVMHAVGEARAGWDPTIFGGWNIKGLPGLFPVGYEAWIYHPDLSVFLRRAAYVAFVHFVLCGLVAFLFLQGLFCRPWVSLVGAVLYQCAFACVLRLTQSDQTFAVLILGPFLLWAARRTIVDRSNLELPFLAVGCAWLMWFTFLQEAAYVVLLLAAYLAFTTAAERAWRRGLLAAGCAAAGLALGLPRIWVVGRELTLVVRTGSDRTFDQLFEFQNIRPWEILRFFDDTILGRNHAEGFLSNLNFSEGLQLFTAQITPFLLLWLFARRADPPPPQTPSNRELAFYGYFLGATVAVICLKPAYHLVYLLFAGLDFHHTRIMVSGLPPLVALLGAALVRLDARVSPAGPIQFRTAALGATIGVLTALAIRGLTDLISSTVLLLPSGRWQWVSDPNLVLHVRGQAVAAIALSAGTMLGAYLLAHRRAGTALAAATAIFLGAMATTQALLAAHYQLLGPHTLSPVPFVTSNSWHPRREDFHAPTPAELDQIYELLDQPRYRAAVVRTEDRTRGLLASSTARFFGLQVIDGYGSGVPRNLAWLPWHPGQLRLRQIHFGRADDLPWNALALTGVKHVWLTDRHLYSADPARLAPSTVLTNPLPVVPLMFFPRHTTAFSTAEACQAWMKTDPSGLRLDMESVSVVRATTAPAAGGGAEDIITVRSRPGVIEVDLAASDSPRFLVLNTRWHPGWKAECDGFSAPVFETNGFMMGVPVPAGSRRIALTFHSFAWAFR